MTNYQIRNHPKYNSIHFKIIIFLNKKKNSRIISERNGSGVDGAVQPECVGESIGVVRGGESLEASVLAERLQVGVLSRQLALRQELEYTCNLCYFFWIYNFCK